MKKNSLVLLHLFSLLLATGQLAAQTKSERKISFNSGWKFFLGDNKEASGSSFDDNNWRNLDLPHDWSIELPFDKESPTGTGGGALRGGTGWYRKTFLVPASNKGKFIAITFDGVYRNSEVWINGNYLGKRPYGYSSFQYELSPYLNYGATKNSIAVRVDNSEQPNSRWYSGSGIYRNVWLTVTDKIHILQDGTFITTPEIDQQSAKVDLTITLGYQHLNGNKRDQDKLVTIQTMLYDRNGKQVAREFSTKTSIPANNSSDTLTLHQQFMINGPHRWSVDSPYLYRAVTKVIMDGRILDEYITPFGIRTIFFDSEKGFLLNDKPLKIFGVCDHHDLGCLGAAMNKSALRRQLQLLKAMGCNSIRTSHNPPAPELLDLCDEMGFLVMDEAFDMWKIEKTKYDYHLDWDVWHKRDLEDMVKRDRNHPSVFIWSIGNEVVEQWDKKDSSGTVISTELASIVRSLDTTRPITAACNSPYPDNPVIKSGALDLIGYNYEHNNWPSFHERFPGKKFISTESVSALETRGHYDMPSDSIRRWPVKWDKPLTEGNGDTTCSAYDNCSAPWGSTHEETWKILKKYEFLSGMYIWTGFDYLGEPTPYTWPARSSYFGIIDLAGFPKDVYYMYQSEWTTKPVLHLLPHWNWNAGDSIDVWAYYNNAEEVELFLNGRSLGKKRKVGDDLHVWWRVKYAEGTIKAVSMRNGKTVLTSEIKTAGEAAKIILVADRKRINKGDDELCFVTAKVVDKAGNTVPSASNLIHFKITGEGTLAGVDNGSETDLSSFKSDQHKAFNGLCLAIIRAEKKNGSIRLTASADGLQSATLSIQIK